MFGISLLPIIPLRSEPSSKSEMVNQLLFGEKYKVLHIQPDWLKIVTIDDNYIGWINDTQAHLINETEWNNLTNASIVTKYPFVKILVNQAPMLISTGSKLYKTNFNISNYQFAFENIEVKKEVTQIAMQYLNTPYLWGGKSPWGIDCSGFTQTVFNQMGISLNRNANQQAEQGDLLAFLTEAKLGDLAFFDNENGKITHVGIMLSNETIIHANGKVRIDKIDNYGILNTDSKKYSHKLRFIKRIKI
jgi:cell wall-associated NlpC family hydrolase